MGEEVPELGWLDSQEKAHGSEEQVLALTRQWLSGMTPSEEAFCRAEINGFQATSLCPIQLSTSAKQIGNPKWTVFWTWS